MSKYIKICFMETNPELISEIHPTKNEKVDVRKLNRSSTKKIWWLCKNGHEYEAQVYSRTRSSKSNKPSGCFRCNKYSGYSNFENSLQMRQPELIEKYWNFELNILKPTEVSEYSNKMVWWRCPVAEDHIYQKQINRRGLTFKCPCCSGKKVVKSESIGVKYPTILDEWGDTRDPYKTFHKDKILLKCKEGHLYKTKALTRLKGLVNCKFCLIEKRDKELQEKKNRQILNRDMLICRKIKDTLKVKKYKSSFLKDTNPVLYSQIDRDLNSSIDIEKLKTFSDKKIKWKCSMAEDHIWSCSVKYKSGCPCCSVPIKKVVFSNCLKTTHPLLCEEWDYNKNKISPLEVSRGSLKKIWWLCKKGHSFITSPSRRTNLGSDKLLTHRGCPYCNNRIIFEENCLSQNHPRTLDYWDYDKNKSNPQNYFKNTSKKVWWKCCKSEKHVWEQSVKDFVKILRCPYCENRKAYDENCLRNLRPDLCELWDYNRNFPKTPDNVTYCSSASVWWGCPVSEDHIYKARISEKFKGLECLCCIGKVDVQSMSVGVKCPEILDKCKNSIYQVNYKSLKKYDWFCNEEKDHVWNCSVRDMVEGKSCPYCKGWGLVDSMSLTLRHPRILEKWDYEKNHKFPNQFNYMDRRSLIALKCFNNHCYKTTPYHEVVKNAGCYFCNGSRGEKKIQEILDLMGISYKKQASIEGCIYKKHLRFDFKVELDSKIFLIEFQGKQHYEDVSFFNSKGSGSLELNMFKDNIKREFCKKQGLFLIEIPYWDFENIEYILKKEMR